MESVLCRLRLTTVYSVVNTGHCVQCGQYYWSLCPVVNIGQCGQYWSLCSVWSILVSMDNTGHRVKYGRYCWSLCPVWSILLVTVDSVVSTGQCGQYWSLCSVWSVLVTVSPVWSILASDPSVCPCS